MEPSNLISVVIPTYNRADAVCSAVNSVLNQTYSNLEVIVVDDGSTDDTQARLSQFGDRIQVITAKNSGASAARNRGIGAAKGGFVAFLDSDDMWLPTKLQRQLTALQSLGNQFGACFTDCRYVGNSAISYSAFEQAGLRSGLEFSPLDSPLDWVLARFPAIYIQSLVVERGLLSELRGFDESMVVCEDTDLLFRLALKTKFCFVPSKLVEIDRTPGRTVGLTELFFRKAEQMYESRRTMYNKWLSLPNLLDKETRDHVQIQQRDLLFEWTIARLYRLEFQRAMEVVLELRKTGITSYMIFNTLVTRGTKKLIRSFRSSNTNSDWKS